MLKLAVNVKLLRQKIAVYLSTHRNGYAERIGMRYIWVVLFSLGLLGAAIWRLNLAPNVPQAGLEIVGCAIFCAVYSAVLRKVLNRGQSWRHAVLP